MESNYRIAIITQPEYFRPHYENELDSFGEVFEFPMKFFYRASDYSPLLKYDADFNIFFRGEFVPSEVLDKLNGVKINLSSEPFPRYINGSLKYTKDSTERYRLFTRIRHKPYDYVFHYDKSSLKFLEEDGIVLSGEFILPVARSVYRKKDLPKKWDFFFIGRSTEHREKYFIPLKHKYNFLHIAHGVTGEMLADFVNQSRIVLNIHAENEISWEPRMQLMMAIGGCIVSEPISENDYLVPGTDFIQVNDVNTFIEQCVYLLENEDERDRISKNCQKKIERFFDAKTAFQRLLEGITGGSIPKVQYSTSRFDLSRFENQLPGYSNPVEQVQKLNGELYDIYSSHAWKSLDFITKIKHQCCPYKSKRYNLALNLYHFVTRRRWF